MTTDRRKPQVGKQLLLRFPEESDLRDRLDEIAKLNGRSTTAEVLIRLEASMKRDEAAGELSFLRSVKAGRERALNDVALEARVAALEAAVSAMQK